MRYRCIPRRGRLGRVGTVAHVGSLDSEWKVENLCYAHADPHTDAHANGNAVECEVCVKLSTASLNQTGMETIKDLSVSHFQNVIKTQTLSGEKLPSSFGKMTVLAFLCWIVCVSLETDQCQGVASGSVGPDQSAACSFSREERAMAIFIRRASPSGSPSPPK